MNFVEYNKIETTSKNWDFNYKKVKQWAVTEKVHGANFSFIYNKLFNNFNYAKRTGILNDDDTFFGYKNIINDYTPYLINIINEIKLLEIQFTNIIIYGELFGGIYPNTVCQYKPIQKGIYYSPNIHFYAFDILIINDNTFYYLDFYKAIEIFKKSGIMYCKPLAIFNKLNDALNYNYNFESTIYKKFKLPTIKNNKAEGVVIRSMTDRYIVKLKISEFSETKYSDNSISKNDIYKIAKTHITQNRFNNTVSKVGTDNYESIINLFINDILVELDITDNILCKKLKDFLYKEINIEISNNNWF